MGKGMLAGGLLGGFDVRSMMTFVREQRCLSLLGDRNVLWVICDMHWESQVREWILIR